MSLSQIPSRRKQRPSSLDELDPISSYSKENTEKSMQGSLYDCENTSMNTYGFSSNRSRPLRKESMSVKSRISSKNMIDFEEFVVDNANDNLLKALENNTSYISSNTTRNKESEALKESKRENYQDLSAPAEFLKVDADEKTQESNRNIKSEAVVPPKEENQISSLPQNASENIQTPCKDTERPSALETGIDQSQGNAVESLRSPLADQTATNYKENRKWGRFTGRGISFEDFCSRRRSENITTGETSLDVVETKPAKKFGFASEFRSLKEEVVSIQKELKSSEAYNKKLEEYIQSQKVQIETILKNFNAIGEENNALKKKLPEVALQKSAEQKKETKNDKQEIYKDIDHVVSKKVNKYYKQEMEMVKEKYNKTFQNFEKIISDMQRQLEIKDIEIKELQNQNPLANSALTRNLSTKSQPLFEQLQVTKTQSSNKEIKSPEFHSLNKLQISEDRFFGASCDEPNDIKSPKTSRDLHQQVSPTDMKYIQYMADISEKLDEMKRNDQKMTKRMNQSMKPQIPTGLSDKSQKSLNKEPRSFSLEQPKLTLHGSSTFEETSLDDAKGSMIEASFDISTGKNCNKEEHNLFNLSPSKNKHMPILKQEKSKKSIPSSQNASQTNEMSMINETLSENFVTESIHNKLAWEFQRQFGFGPKKSTDSSKLSSKTSKEDSQEKDYNYIEKMHRYVQGAKKKTSCSTPSSKMNSYTDKTLSKDQISLQRSKDEATSFTNNTSSGNLKGKDYYFSSSLAKGEASNVLKPSNTNLPNTSMGTNQSLKPSRTLSSYEKNNDSYSKAAPKNSEKKSRSATNSQDKVAKKSKDKSENMSKVYDHPSLHTQNNETIVDINSAIDKMLEKGHHSKTHNLLEREKKFMKTQPYRKSELIPDFDDMCPLPSHSSNDYNQIKLSTAPLSSYLQLVRTGSSEYPTSHTSQRTNLADIENKENFSEHPSRSSVSTNKGSKQSNYPPTQINLDEPAFYNPSTIPPKSVGEHSKTSGHKRPSAVSASSQARHHTPTTKVYLDVFPTNETKEQVMKIPKKVERIPPREMDEINLDNFNNKLMGKPRSSSNKASSNNKNGTRGPQPYANYPVYNNLVLDEFGNPNQMGKTGKTPNYRSAALDQKSYDFMHQTDRESAMKKSKDENNKYDTENMPNGPEGYVGQNQGKNRRESYRPYNVYNYDSKKYM